MSDLWCVHVLGPDDVYPCATRTSATLMANDINVKFGKIAADNGVTFKAVVDPWPHSAESHAEGVKS